MRHEQFDLTLNFAALEIVGSDIPARMYTYLLDNSEEIDPNRKRPCVVICPGGGYAMTSDREAEALAVRMNAAGFQAVIVRYSVNPARYPTSLLETAKAVAMVRERAEEWHVHPDQIIVMGFSAGGHLACSLGVFWKDAFLSEKLGISKEQIKPNGLILGYPVISSVDQTTINCFENLLGRQDAWNPQWQEKLSLENWISKQTPPAFVWHTFDDPVVSVENSLRLAEAYRRQSVSMELHIFPEGPHGLSLANEETTSIHRSMVQPECQVWIDLAIVWITNLFHKK